MRLLGAQSISDLGMRHVSGYIPVPTFGIDGACRLTLDRSTLVPWRGISTTDQLVLKDQVYGHRQRQSSSGAEGTRRSQGPVAAISKSGFCRFNIYISTSANRSAVAVRFMQPHV